MALTVGAVVPNFNYARYLMERLASVRAQERPVDALVFLDDASTDDSRTVAPPLLRRFGCPVVTQSNEVNSGSVLGQWQAGLRRLDTDLVWIAEADDRARPGLLAALAARLEADPRAILAFCDAAPIDAEGREMQPDNQAYYAAHGDDGLAQDGVFDAAAFLSRFLCPRNMVLTASAVLWRRRALAAALAAIAGELRDWLCAGDWRVYVEACAAGGTVHYVAMPLAEHRRHAASVTRATPAPRHWAEVVAMHVHLRQRLGPEAGRDRAMQRHLAELRRAWGLGPASSVAVA